MSFSLRTPHQKPQLRKALPSEEQVQLSTAHEHFRQQPRPRTSVVTQAQTSTYLLAASGPLTHSWSSAASWTTGRTQHGFRWPHIPSLASRWPAKAAKPRHQSGAQASYVQMDVRLHLGLGQQHGPRTSSTMVSGSIMDKKAQRRQENDKKYLWPREKTESNLNHA